MKENICISSFYQISVPAPENDPSLPAIVSDECLDVEVEIATSPGQSQDLKCKLLDAWPLRVAVLAMTDDNYFHDRITINFSIRSKNYPSSMFDSLPRGFH